MMRLATDWLEDVDEVDELALFLDFDGTLAPIVDRPGDARALDGIAELIETIGDHIPVAIISGRGLDDVTKRLGTQGIYYAGSHGLEMQDEMGERHESEEVRQALPELRRQEKWLRDKFADETGIEVERKRFGVAIHFRQRPQAREWVEELLQEAVQSAQGLKVSTGKMVRELQPDVDRDKGTALQWIRHRIDPEGVRRPIYIGDDVTDEDAFREIEEQGVGILVARKRRDSAARFRLDDPGAVKDFLARMARRLSDDG